MTGVDWTAVIEGFGMVAGLVGAIISLWVRATIAAKIAAATAPLEDRIGAQHDLILRLSAKCDAQATRDDVHAISLDVKGVLGELKAMKVGMEGMRSEQAGLRASVTRVNDYLLNEKSK